MGVRILSNRDDSEAVMYCSTSMWAFGPVAYEREIESRQMVYPASELIEHFLEWMREVPHPNVKVVLASFDGDDPREYSDGDLEKLWNEFLTELDAGRWIPKGERESDANEDPQG